MKRILLCTESWPPVGSGGGVQRPMKFAKYLPDHGYAAEALTPETDPRMFLPDPSLLEEVAHVPRHAVRRTRTRRSRLPGDLRRLLDRIQPRRPLPDAFIHSLPAFRERALALHREQPFDLVLTTSPPHSFALLGLDLRSSLKIPWVADFRDEWGGNRRRRRAQTDDEAAQDRTLELAAYRGADRIVVTTEVMRRNILDTSGVDPRTVSVIPNGYDEEDIPPSIEHIYGGRMVVLFGGALNAYRDLRSLFQALRLVFRRAPDLPLEVRLVTPAGRSRRYLEGTDDLFLRGALRVVDFLPHRRSLEEAARADVLLHVLSNCAADEEHVPGKLFEYLALGRPILFLTSVRGENTEILERAGGGMVVDVGDPGAIAAALSVLVDRWRARDLPRLARDVSRYSRRRLTAHLAAELDGLLSSSSFPVPHSSKHAR